MKKDGIAAGCMVAAVALALSGCAAASGTTGKAGASTAAVTLRVATDDTSDKPVGAMLAELARQVDQRSGGSLKIEPVWQAAGSGADWDQRNARLVMKGTTEMGIIPSRAWDTEGVLTLRALNTPFLVTNEKLVRDVVSGPLAETMMAGLEPVGVHGLALIPEGMRHPFGYAAGLVSVDAFAGKRVRAATSQTVRDMFVSFGGTSTDDEVNHQSQVGMESSYAFAEKSTAAGNVTFFPKVQTLVINTKVLESLSDEQRTALSEAAAAARDAYVASAKSDAEEAAAFCANGGAVVLATPEQLDGLVRATRPLVQRLRADPTTSSVIDAITELKKQDPDPAPVSPCGSVTAPPTSSASAPSGSTSGQLDGVYRFSLTDDQLRKLGMTGEGDLAENHGVYTWTLKGDSFCWVAKAPNPQNNPSDCGKLAIDGDRVTFTYDDGSFESFTWTQDAKGTLHLTVYTAVDRMSAAWGVNPWVRIGDAH